MAQRMHGLSRSHASLVAIAAVLVLVALAPIQGAADAECGVNGLVAYWKFDEGQGGSVADECGLTPGIIRGASWANGIGGGQSLLFDGADDLVIVGNTSSISIAGDITVLMWVWIGERQPVEGYELLNKAGSYCFYLYQAGTTCTIMGAITTSGHGSHPQGASPITYGAWHQVGFVYGDIDGSGVRKIGNIVDGRVAASAPLTGSIDVTKESLTLNARMLHRLAVDDIRIYSRALTPAQIAAAFTDI